MLYTFDHSSRASFSHFNFDEINVIIEEIFEKLLNEFIFGLHYCINSSNLKYYSPVSV